MARVELEKLTAGMRLIKPVFNLHGVLLLKAGEVLTEKHLGIFKTCGIRAADVSRDNRCELEVHGETALPQEILEMVEAETARRFRRAEANTGPVMAEILRVVMLGLRQRHAAPPANTLKTDPETA